MLRNWQLLAAGMWLLFSTLLFLRNVIAPGQFDSPYADRAAWVTLALAGWNLFRWFIRWSAGRERVQDVSPLQPKRDGEPKYEYNPDLDFQKMDREVR